MCSGLPLMIGWFSLNLPAGLSLYYFSNTVFTSGQQIFLRKLGGAKLAEYDLGPIALGKARRTGESVAESVSTSALSDTAYESDTVDTASSTSLDGLENEAAMITSLDGGAAMVRELNRRCKRKRLTQDALS